MADLNKEPFSFSVRKGDIVDLRFEGRSVKTLKDRAAVQFLHKIDRLNAHEAQLLMARVTGQFKMGNERNGQESNGRKINGQKDNGRAREGKGNV